MSDTRGTVVSTERSIQLYIFAGTCTECGWHGSADACRLTEFKDPESIFTDYTWHCPKCDDGELDDLDFEEWQLPALDALTAENKRLAERVRELDAALHEVNEWRGLDGDGITVPVLDTVRTALGLPPYDEDTTEDDT